MAKISGPDDNLIEQSRKYQWSTRLALDTELNFGHNLQEHEKDLSFLKS